MTNNIATLTPNFSTLLKNWRKSHKYSQTDACKLLGVSKTMYGYWEQNKNLPSTHRINDISKVMMLSSDEISNSMSVSNQSKRQAKELKKYNIKKNPSIVKTAVVQPVVVNTPKEEPMSAIEFDNLLVKYTKKLNEKEKLMSDWLSIKDKIEAIKLELVEIRDEIRKNA